MIQSLPEHNLGNQKMTYRMAANAIWNKLNFAMSMLKPEQYGSQLETMMKEARALADSIVHDERSGEEPGEKAGCSELTDVLREYLSMASLDGRPERQVLRKRLSGMMEGGAG